MVNNQHISIQNEYDTLREELLQAKKYIFERPLLIVALCVGASSLVARPYVGILPLVLSLVSLYNYWFTANRLMSAARIVAYIQLELEERKIGKWVGWETCLRYHRKWQKLNKDKEIVVEDKDFIPEAILYYPQIHKLHIVLMFGALTGSAAITITSFSLVNIACLICVGYVTYLFCPDIKKYNPNWAKQLSEYNRAIWKQVFNYMVSKGAK